MEGEGRPARPCVLKRIHTADSEAASVLLRCQLPPELGVGFRNSSSTQLRTSVSESNVSSPVARLQNPAPKSAFRTLSDGQPSSCFRRKLQSEDSSYDSDYECPPQLVTVATGHDDVSRTVSDTLDQELGDFGAAQQRVPAHCDKDCPNAGTQLPNPDLINYIKFALKLGYTEQQAETVLKQVGTKPAEDEFLSGLIRLDKLTGPSTPTVRPADIPDTSAPLRYIVVDGSNVAMTHGNKERFSCRGIQICVDWFLARGHKNITVLVPMWRKETSTVEAPISDQKILLELERDKLLIFTPSRQAPDGRRIICYDDRYILQVARDNDAIVVSNDNYRDLAAESPEFRPIIDKRILMYSFVNDRFMPPEDPLGRNGPKLDQFLRNTPAPPCPYNIRCTYGNKCKYYHPERLNNPHKSISEQLSENAHRKLREVASKSKLCRDIPADVAVPKTKKPVQRRMTNSPVRSLPPSLVEERPVRDQLYPHHGLNLPPPAHSGIDGSRKTHRQVSRQQSLHPEDLRMSSNPLLVPPYPPPNVAGVHSQVFRIQSAPYPAAFNPSRRLSCSSSDNQLNLLGSSTSINHLDTHVPPPLYGESSHLWPGQALSLPAGNFEKKRRDIYYHLRAILPEELVLKALQMMPEETDAVRICAAISSLASGRQNSPY